MLVRGDRLMLREFVAADVAPVHAYASDPLVTRFLIWGPNSLEDTRQFIAEAIASSQSPDRTSFDLAAAESASSAPIGGAAVRVVDIAGRQGDIGYVLHRDFWSRGYATEIVRLLLEVGFDKLGLRRITATCDPDNLASARVLEKAGFQFEGKIDRHMFVRGSWRDSLLFARHATDS